MAFITTTHLTELEAVNILLAAIGETAVTSIETATTPEVTQAKTLLSNVNREIQQKGWSFNSEWDVTLTRDGSNFLPLGSSIMSVQVPGTRTTFRGQSGVMYLYDLENNTFVWTKDITNASTVTLLDFIDTPQTFRQYVVVRAARIYQEEVIGQGTAEQINSREEVEALATLMDDESSRAGYNVGWGTPLMVRTLKQDRKLY